ncbi:MAG: HlyC/CorC family transporter [Burkholderiaceae bacterium]
MEALPLWAQILILLALLLASGFFSISEISMMAMNRYRLSHMVKQGKRSARRASSLLDDTEHLLGTILIGNNIVNAALTAIVTSLAIRAFGNNDTVVLTATVLVAVLIILFCEIGPKVVGATYPEQVALPASLPLSGLQKLLHPFVWLANHIVLAVLRLFGLSVGDGKDNALSQEELRNVVVESSKLVPSKHRSILLNLFDLENITVDDVMVPRQRIEAIDLASDEDTWREQLRTCYHNKLPVFEREINHIVGILHVRQALTLLHRDSFSAEDIREHLSQPYFVPSGTPVFTQLQFFQERKQRFALVVDEYGELQGLVTLADIIEEFVGEMTTSVPGRDDGPLWDPSGRTRVEGSSSLRELNRRLGIALPLTGPKTLNGLVLETLEQLPDAPVSIRFGDVVLEVMQIEGRAIRSLILHRIGKPAPRPPAS